MILTSGQQLFLCFAVLFLAANAALAIIAAMVTLAGRKPEPPHSLANWSAEQRLRFYRDNPDCATTRQWQREQELQKGQGK